MGERARRSRLAADSVGHCFIKDANDNCSLLRNTGSVDHFEVFLLQPLKCRSYDNFLRPN